MKVLLLLTLLGVFVHCDDLVVEDEAPSSSNEEAEKLEALFKQLSPVCAAELQKAYAEGTEVSPVCKAQIKEIMAPEQKESKKKAKQEEDPTNTILAFVAFCLFGLVAWGIYAQKAIVENLPVASNKKLSKKKQEKQKRKQQ